MLCPTQFGGVRVHYGLLDSHLVQSYIAFPARVSEANCLPPITRLFFFLLRQTEKPLFRIDRMMGRGFNLPVTLNLPAAQNDLHVSYDWLVDSLHAFDWL